MTSIADITSKAEAERAQADHDERRRKDAALKAAHDARAGRMAVLQIAAQIPVQGGGFWRLVEQIENYIDHGQPTEIMSDVRR